jgi:hypothetical protein
MRRDVSIEIVKGNPRRIDGTFFKIGLCLDQSRRRRRW